MAATRGWSEKRYDAARRVLAECHTIAEASGRLGVPLRTLTDAFIRIGDSPGRHLKPRARPAWDPEAAVAKRERADAATTIRRLQEELAEIRRASDFFTRIKAVPAITAAKSRERTGKRPGTPVTMCSDLHCGEVVTAEETMGRNVYGIAEFRRRMGNFWDNVLWLRNDWKRHTTCDDHVLNLNGDLISGNIHPELTETNEVGLTDQVDICIDAVLPGIKALSEDSRKVIVMCTSGNHARITPKSQIKTGWDNSLETILYRTLVRETRPLENVQWLVPRAQYVQVDVHGFKLQAQHGTEIKSQGGIGGILVPLNRFAVRAASAHFYLFGHFHQAQWFDQVIVNGSLIGDSAYSRAHAMSFREPEQVMFLLDERRGPRHFERVSVT